MSVKFCAKCKKEVKNKDWHKKKCVYCGGKDFLYSTKNGPPYFVSNSPVYDG